MLRGQVLLVEFPFLRQSVAWLQTQTSGRSHGKLSRREKITNAYSKNGTKKSVFLKVVARV